MVADRFSELPASAFVRLRALLEGVESVASPLDATIGDPRHPMPPFVTDILNQHVDSFRGYPPPAGPANLREAIASWIARRYGVAAPDPETQVLAVSGTREALFNTCLACCPTEKNGQPAILIPNPFYQCYAAGAAAAGAEAIFWNATEDTGHLPDIDAIDDATWARTALIFMCSPANPQGAVADETYWRRLIEKARAHNAVILADECYSEIYTGTPPTGIIEVAGGDLSNILMFNSLSKRSNLAGLRQGFVAGDAREIAKLWKLRSLGGAPTPVPLCAVAEAAWSDEAHVEDNRALYDEKFALADAALGNRFAYRRPAGGFFLWLNTALEWGLDGEAAATRLWAETGLRALPGAYLSRDTEAGNPGTDYLRIAMVFDRPTTEDLLDRLTRLT